MTNQPRVRGKPNAIKGRRNEGLAIARAVEKAVTRELNGNERSLSFCIDSTALRRRDSRAILTGMRRP
ncbi:hypothetical protein [Planctomycetes bacterium TBK1r]|uniref:hypothetical protein n=1 Tax=Stieleria magnilauensis TaxID=2527963 RepID=UPI0011A1868E